MSSFDFLQGPTRQTVDAAVVVVVVVSSCLLLVLSLFVMRVGVVVVNVIAGDVVW